MATAIQQIRELAETKGAHRAKVHTVQKKDPRVYQAFCKDCPWEGSKGSGTLAAKEALEHSVSTVKAQPGDAQAVESEATPVAAAQEA